MTETVIDLIRHGEPVGGYRFRGHHIDDPLTEKGWSQMWTAVDNYSAWQQIITSPLQRCQQFARALAERHGIPLVVEPRFKEVGLGCWEGLSHDEIKLGRADEYQTFLNDPVNHRPQGAEDLAEFIKRVGSAYDEIIEKDHSKHCLIVTHAGVIRAIITRIVHAGPAGLYRIKINNGGITRMRHTETGGVLELLNGTLSDGK